jgi:hypothetical protein
VGEESGEDRGSTAEVSVGSWVDEAEPCAGSLLAATTTALRLLRRRQGKDEAIGEAIAGIRYAGQLWQQWVFAHPCPDVRLGDRFQIFVSRCKFLALEMDRNRADAAYLRTANNRLKILNSEFTEFLSDPCADEEQVTSVSEA